MDTTHGWYALGNAVQIGTITLHLCVRHATYSERGTVCSTCNGCSVLIVVSAQRPNPYTSTAHTMRAWPRRCTSIHISRKKHAVRVDAHSDWARNANRTEPLIGYGYAFVFACLQIPCARHHRVDGRRFVLQLLLAACCCASRRTVLLMTYWHPQPLGGSLRIPLHGWPTHMIPSLHLPFCCATCICQLCPWGNHR